MKASTAIRTTAVTLLPLALLGSTVPTAERFEIDRNHSRIGFAARHMGVATVRGHFTDFAGHVLLDTADITRSTAHVIINTGSVTTGNERRDNHLRSDDFFNAEAYPQIVFTGRHVEQDGAQLTLVGDLTIRDVTREVRLPFDLVGPVSVGGRQRLGAEGDVTVNRRDFKLLYNNLVEGIAVVSDEIRLEIAIEATTPREAD